MPIREYQLKIAAQIGASVSGATIGGQSWRFRPGITPNFCCVLPIQPFEQISWSDRFLVDIWGNLFAIPGGGFTG